MRSERRGARRRRRHRAATTVRAGRWLPATRPASPRRAEMSVDQSGGSNSGPNRPSIVAIPTRPHPAAMRSPRREDEHECGEGGEDGCRNQLPERGHGDDPIELRGPPSSAQTEVAGEHGGDDHPRRWRPSPRRRSRRASGRGPRASRAPVRRCRALSSWRARATVCTGRAGREDAEQGEEHRDDGLVELARPRDLLEDLAHGGVLALRPGRRAGSASSRGCR